MSNNVANIEELSFVNNSSNQQRTAEWFEKRRGRFTGSKIIDLMSCTTSTAKLEWGRAEKLIDFGEAAKKYVYSKAKEIQRNKVVQTPAAAAMKYGTNNEPVVFQLLQKTYPNAKFETCDFIEFIPLIAGASPDGLVRFDFGDIAGLEIKCATDWGGVYDRAVVKVDQKNKDFWQLQSEMLALKVNQMMYVIAEPSENMFEPNITDLEIVFVDASEIHQKAIKHRCMIGSKAIALYLSGIEFNTAIMRACTEYEIIDF